VLISPLLLFMGVRIPWLAGFVMAGVIACAVTAAVLYFRKVTASYGRLLLALMVSGYGALMASVFGPLVFVPGFAAVNTVLFAAQGSPRHRVTIVLCGCASFVLPFALELAGVVPRSMLFTEAGMLLVPRVTDLPESVSLLSLVAVSMLGVIAPAVVATRLRDALFRAEEKLLIHKYLEARTQREPAHGSVVAPCASCAPCPLLIASGVDGMASVSAPPRR
jgi:serine/threonine-protein kinase